MKVILKRFVSGLLTVWLISILLFFMFHVFSGDPVLAKLGADEIDRNPELVEALRHEYGLDQPMLQRYFSWFVNALHGDLGASFKYNAPVAALIAKRLLPTVTLAVLSLVLTIAVSISVGIFVCTRSKKNFGVLYNIFTQLGIAVPVFWLAVVLIWLFAVRTNVFSARSFVDFSKPLASLRSLILPAITLCFGNISAVLRFFLNAVNGELKKQYVVFAKAKGMLDDEVLKKHILKNSLISLVTVFTFILINLMTGSIFVENIFNLQGIGSLLINAIKESDYPLVQGIVLFYSVLVVLANLALDFIYMKIDPRIRWQ